ncbi:MAG: hypothetical protein IJ017_04580 [Oscillospiraceae bacterium]|nr:hypothetical protein [Oscillospiraceae bacterium]
MATAESVKTKIQGLIDTANEATGGTDTDLTAAVNTLIAGFGQGGGGAVLLESGTVTTTSSTSYFIQELSETPDLVLVWAETEITAGATAGVVIAVLPITLLPTDTTPTGAISNFIAQLRYLNGNITNAGETSNVGIFLTDGVPKFGCSRISSSYPLIDGDYHYETYKLWS